MIFKIVTVNDSKIHSQIPLYGVWSSARNNLLCYIVKKDIVCILVFALDRSFKNILMKLITLCVFCANDLLCLRLNSMHAMHIIYFYAAHFIFHWQNRHADRKKWADIL